MSAEVTFYSRGAMVPSSLKAQVTATYVTSSGNFIVIIPFTKVSVAHRTS